PYPSCIHPMQKNRCIDKSNSQYLYPYPKHIDNLGLSTVWCTTKRSVIRANSVMEFDATEVANLGTSLELVMSSKNPGPVRTGSILNQPVWFGPVPELVGKDAHGMLIRDCLASCGVRLDYLNTVSVSTGHAVVMLQPSGQNSIIIVGGANVSWPRLEDGMSRLSTNAQQQIRRAGVILLQREIPDSVNIEVAK
ncbi:hypothetical protein KI387_006706, partial [Taxus chinensis]